MFLHRFNFFFTSYGRLSSKLYNISFPVLMGTVLNIMDAVRTVKVCVFIFCVSFVGWVYPYTDRFLAVFTVSEVYLNLLDGCCCLRVLRTRDSTRKYHPLFIEIQPNTPFTPQAWVTPTTYLQQSIWNITWISHFFNVCCIPRTSPAIKMT